MAEQQERQQARRLGAMLLLIGVLTSAAQAAVLSAPTVFKGLTGANPLVVSPDGQQVYVGSSTDGTLSAFQHDDTGNFSVTTTYSAAVMSGSATAQIMQSLAVSPDGRFVYAGYEASDASAATIAVLQRDGSGILSAAGSVALSASTRLSALAVSPDGAALYAVDTTTLYVYGRDGQSGQLTLQQQFQDTVNGVEGLAGAWGIAVSPDSHFVYVTGADASALAVFGVDNSGQLGFLTAYQDGAGGIIGLADARGVAISPDGKEAYVAAAEDNAVTIFTRDVASGLLQFNHMYQDGAEGFDGLTGAFNLALSPDGSQVYVLGSGEQALSVLGRDGLSGALTQVEVLRQQAPTIDGLSSALGLAVRPDGKQLFVTSPVNNALAVFEIAVTGASAGKTPSSTQGGGGGGGVHLVELPILLAMLLAVYRRRLAA